ncbi:MAG TPA: Uma2 family endonuclease [Xanthobacteraceae bacterium]
MHVAVTTAAEGFPRRAFTVEDVSRMIEAGMLELIEGEIVMMAARGLAHERIKSALAIAVVRAQPRHLTVGVETTLRLTDTVMLEPSIAVFPKDRFKKSSNGFARLEPGDADLVIEVAASNLAYHTGLKARLYARHRVRELWVVDANESSAWVHTAPVGEGWSSIVKCGPGEALTASALPELSIRLGEIA